MNTSANRFERKGIQKRAFTEFEEQKFFGNQHQ